MLPPGYETLELVADTRSAFCDPRRYRTQLAVIEVHVARTMAACVMVGPPLTVSGLLPHRIEPFTGVPTNWRPGVVGVHNVPPHRAVRRHSRLQKEKQLDRVTDEPLRGLLEAVRAAFSVCPPDIALIVINAHAPIRGRGHDTLYRTHF